MPKKKERNRSRKKNNSDRNRVAEDPSDAGKDTTKDVIKANVRLEKCVRALEPAYALIMHAEILKATPQGESSLAKIHIQDFDCEEDGLLKYSTEVVMPSQVRTTRGLGICIIS